MKVLIDTNIFLRSLQQGHAQQSAARDAVSRLKANGHGLFVVPQILYEFWSASTRPNNVNWLGRSIKTVREDVDDIQEMVDLITIDELVLYQHWLEIVTKFGVSGKQVHDARLVAAMQAHRLTHILTFDARFSRFGVTVLDPGAVASDK